MKLTVKELNTSNVMYVTNEVKTAIHNLDCIVDLACVDEFDSSAVVAVLEWIRAAKTLGHTLQLSNVPEKFWKLADLYQIRLLLEEQTINRQ